MASAEPSRAVGAPELGGVEREDHPDDATEGTAQQCGADQLQRIDGGAEAERRQGETMDGQDQRGPDRSETRPRLGRAVGHDCSETIEGEGGRTPGDAAGADNRLEEQVPGEADEQGFGGPRSLAAA
jgi:hypothetical protein